MFYTYKFKSVVDGDRSLGMTINDELMIDIKHLLGNRWSVKREDLDTYSRHIRRAARDVSKLRQSGKGLDGSQLTCHICSRKRC